MKNVFLMLFAAGIILASDTVAAGDICIECHQQKTPGITAYWKDSSHAEKNVTCTSCHGGDVDANHNRTVTVTAEKCGECHKRAFIDHSASRHGIALRSGRGCTRSTASASGQSRNCAFCHEEGSSRPKVATECAMFLAQSPEMQKQGCDACHRVENRCDTCHTRHGTNLSFTRLPQTCGTCHMGPDHAQIEMWETSTHGVLYRQGKDRSGPSCVSCHMKSSSHNVSKGIATGIPDSSELLRKQERAFMLDICSSCHTRSMAGRSLEDADMIEKQSSAIVSEALTIVEDLKKENLLSPTAEERPPHPLFGKNIVTGPHMLYENISTAESIFFKMKQFHYMNAVKGAFHQNPDYTHWYGNAPLKLALSELKSEAALLRSVDLLKKRLDNLSGTDRTEGDAADLKKMLRELIDKRLRGDMSQKDFQEQKDLLMKEKGL